MKLIYYYSAIAVIGAAFMLNACGNQVSLETKVKKAFQEYRDKNLGDNKSDFEIADVSPVDTMTNELSLGLIDDLLKAKSIIRESHLSELRILRNEISKDKGHAYHVAKIRMNEGDRKVMNMFYVIENLNNGSVYIKASLTDDDRPEYMKKLVELSNKILNE